MDFILGYRLNIYGYHSWISPKYMDISEFKRGFFTEPVNSENSKQERKG